MDNEMVDCVMLRTMLTKLAVLVLTLLMAFGLLLPVLPQPARAAGTATPAPVKFTPLPEPKRGKIDQAVLAKIDLEALPLVPKISDRVKAIYQEGVKKGLNKRVLSKVGDCMTATEHFMQPFSEGKYDLGEYASLESVIKIYKDVPARPKDKEFKLDSFANPGMAATSGFNAASVLDPLWADPKVCKSDESPLACEYRVSRPSVSLIMFGTNDLKTIRPEDYDYYLRRVVVQTANAGIVPLVTTFPVQPGMEKETQLFNQIAAKIAADYDVPLINLYLAMKPLPNWGIDPKETTHMTLPENKMAGDLTRTGLKGGYNLHNLLTLQTLEALFKAVNPALLENPGG